MKIDWRCSEFAKHYQFTDSREALLLLQSGYLIWVTHEVKGIQIRGQIRLTGRNDVHANLSTEITAPIPAEIPTAAVRT